MRNGEAHEGESVAAESRTFFCAGLGRSGSEDVERTSRWVAQFLYDVGVDHGRLDVRVPQVLLDLPDIHAVEQQVRREAVAQGVYGNRLVDLRFRTAAFTAFWMTESLRW